jgi:hypothetical protein
MRHGESAGNVARDAAYATRQVWIDIAERGRFRRWANGRRRRLVNGSGGYRKTNARPSY